MNTLPPLVIVADRGHLKAFKPGAERGLQLLHTTDFKEGLEKLSEQLTDQAGAFPDGGTMGHGTSTAERLTLVDEIDSRIFRRIGQVIDQLHSEHTPGPWALAAPSEINRAILSEISPSVRDSLALNLPLDLTNTPHGQLAEHFVRGRDRQQK